MSLSTHIAIGPSRRLAFGEAVMVAGGVACSMATFLACWFPERRWFVFVPLALLCCAFAGRVLSRRLRCRPDRVVIFDQGRVALQRRGDTVQQECELSEATVVWPGFAVLSLKPTSRTRASRRALVVPVVRAEVDPHDARQLHRFLLWVERGGLQLAGAIRKDSLG